MDMSPVHKYHSEQVASQMQEAWTPSSAMEQEWDQGVPGQKNKTGTSDSCRLGLMGRVRMDSDYNLKEILLMKGS